jgi:hypothetical protein
LFLPHTAISVNYFKSFFLHPGPYTC